MPVSFNIDQDKNLINVFLEGRVTAKELKTLADDLRNHDDFNPSYDRLVDLSRIDKIEISTDTVREFAKTSEQTFHDSSRRAIIASSDFMYGISRMYQAIANKLKQTRVFRTREDAEKWLSGSSH